MPNNNQTHIIRFDGRYFFHIVKNLFIKTALLLALLTANACAMSPKFTYDSQTQITKYNKLFTVPASVPFDLTKKGNKIEFELKIKEENGYAFELRFYYDDPRRSKYEWVEVLKSFFPERPSTKEERIDLERVKKLVGTKEFENGKWTIYPGISTPIHLMIIKLEDEGSEKLVFDEVVEDFEKHRTKNTCGGLSCNREMGGMGLRSGTYKFIVEALKDAPEFNGTRINFLVARSGSGKP